MLLQAVKSVSWQSAIARVRAVVIKGAWPQIFARAIFYTMEAPQKVSGYATVLVSVYLLIIKSIQFLSFSYSKTPACMHTDYYNMW